MRVKSLIKLLEKGIFACRWILIASYIKLIVILVEISYLFWAHNGLTTHEIIDTLEAVDIVMILNLVKSIITGSYNSFVSKEHGRKGENVSSGALKVKMGTSLIGISSILLLQIFLAVNKDTSWDMIWKLLAIHAAFLVSALIMAVIEFLHVKSEWYEYDMAEEGKSDSSNHSSVIVMHDSPDRDGLHEDA